MTEAGANLIAAAEKAVGEGTALFDSFSRLMEGAPPEQIETLLGNVDGSDYSLADWIEALVEFDAWLVSRNWPERPIGEMLGYIHCCTLMQSPGLRSPILKVIVYQSLTEFGFAAISEAQI